MDSSERLKRLILELPWLSKNKSVTIDQFCKTFSISQEQAVKDLTLLTFVGPSQFGGDLVDIQISDEIITVVDNQKHGNSMRFTPEELMVLIASLNLLIQGDQTNLTLKSLNDKIISIFYKETSEKQNKYENILNVLQNSIESKKLINMDYIDGRNYVKQNVLIKVLAIDDMGGFKYLQGIDCKNNSTKSYRLDRILRVSLSDEKHDIASNSLVDRESFDVNIVAPYWKKSIIEKFNLENVQYENNTLDFHLTFFDFNFVKTLIYSLGSQIKVKTDKSVKNEILGLIKQDIDRLS
ncbi:MAG: WYL domain-containing protein [Actinomycetes bacterium]